jgi:hypothetical protein
MAKGWESKSVEEQAAEKQDEDLRVATRGAAVLDSSLQRERQSLSLQRERILDERTSNPHRRAALVAALEEIEGRLARLA